MHVQEASLFGPTYLRLRDEEKADPKPYQPLARGRHTGKGKQVDRFSQDLVVDDMFNEGMGAASASAEQQLADDGRDEFELEKNWILTYVGTSSVQSLTQIPVIGSLRWISQPGRRG